MIVRAVPLAINDVGETALATPGTADLPGLDHPAGSPDSVFDVRALVQVAEGGYAAPEVIVDRLDGSRDVVGLGIGGSRDQTRIPSDPATCDRCTQTG